LGGAFLRHELARIWREFSRSFIRQNEQNERNEQNGAAAWAWSWEILVFLEKFFGKLHRGHRGPQRFGRPVGDWMIFWRGCGLVFFIYLSTDYTDLRR